MVPSANVFAFLAYGLHAQNYENHQYNITGSNGLHSTGAHGSDETPGVPRRGISLPPDFSFHI